jgi:hypothetical protein
MNPCCARRKGFIPIRASSDTCSLFGSPKISFCATQHTLKLFWNASFHVELGPTPKIPELVHRKAILPKIRWLVRAIVFWDVEYKPQWVSHELTRIIVAVITIPFNS